MWIEACKLDIPERQTLNSGARVDFLTDLSEEERKVCLELVHEHFSKRQGLQLQRGSYVERGKGPELDTPFGDSSFDCNGSGPTFSWVFRWYRQAVFQH